MARQRQALELHFTPDARADLVGIWQWNANEFGVRRADGYVEFLLTEIEKVAKQPDGCVAVPEFPGLMRKLIKRRSRGNGHIVFFRVRESRLEVIHIYHTAQDWHGRLGR